MLLYPVNLRVDGRLCTIVGGGRVAFRKAEALAEGGARLKIISPEIDPAFERLGDGCEKLQRGYRRGDLAGSFLVVAATDDDEVNRAVEAEARELDLLLNVVDRPAECNFFVPSTVRRGELLLTVSTGGLMPALSKRLRQRLEKEFPPEWEVALELAGEARQRVIESFDDEQGKRECLAALAELDLVQLLRDGGEEAARTEIEKCISRY